ncbi:hypothetical protein [Hyalangium versicolor]|uniref:hypothetical protein n=1 Tax=Hyalangium versicolor TaxID=2861190 RepID=UPI001CCB2026|nr:hypothetical protein [Hyalangium versicolor]
MRYAMWLGCVWLGASVAGCGGVRAEAPLIDEKPTAASAGEGGGAEIDTGRWASMTRTPKAEQERRQLYEQVAKDIGLEKPRSGQGGSGWEGTGGGGRAGSERRSCDEVLAANEPAAVVSGELDYAMDGVLTVNVPGQGPMKLLADESTCVVQNHRVRPLDALQVGTETRVSYVLVNGLPTARVLRAEPERFVH